MQQINANMYKDVNIIYCDECGEKDTTDNVFHCQKEYHINGFNLCLKCALKRGAQTHSDININIKELKMVKIETRYIVFGYIRECLIESYHISNIELISYIVLYYYQNNDEWDTYLMSGHIEHIGNNMNSITHIGGINHDGPNGQPFMTGHNRYDEQNEIGVNSYLRMIVTDNVFNWRFKINNVESESIIIGIFDVDDESFQTALGNDWTKWMLFSAQEFTLYGGYGFVLGTAEITDPESGYCFENRTIEYGVICKNNDIVEMELNMNTLTLKYVINDIDYGTAYNVRKARYRAAVFMFGKGDSVSLL
eukprot:463193_1